jgi:hypothetical protein
VAVTKKDHRDPDDGTFGVSVPRLRVAGGASVVSFLRQKSDSADCLRFMLTRVMLE